MLTKKRVYAILNDILTFIFENKEQNVSTATAHLTSIKNVNSQNFAPYIFDKFMKYGEKNKNIIKEIPSETLLNKIKKDYNHDRIYQKEYFNSTKYKLNEDSIYIIKNICGTQSPPDFALLIHGYLPILLEAKSSKGKRPLWNCSLPNKNTIYLFYSGGYNRIFIHLSHHILEDEVEKVLKDLYQEIKILVKKVNEDILKKLNTIKKWDYYPRPMYNQKFDYDLSQIDLFFQDALQEVHTQYIDLSPKEYDSESEEETEEEEEYDSEISELSKNIGKIIIK